MIDVDIAGSQGSREVPRGPGAEVGSETPTAALGNPRMASEHVEYSEIVCQL